MSFSSPNIHPILRPGNNILERLPIYITPFPFPHKEAIGSIGELEYNNSSLKPSSIIGTEYFLNSLYISFLRSVLVTIPVGLL